MDLDSILGVAKVPKTNVFVADSDEALESIEYDEACSYVALYATAGDKQFLLERIHYKNLSKDDKRAENIKLYQMLLGELKKYDIPRAEADLTFSDEYAVPEFIRYNHEKQDEYSMPKEKQCFSPLTLLWLWTLPS